MFLATSNLFTQNRIVILFPYYPNSINSINSHSHMTFASNHSIPPPEL